jgi:hypothetical protein
VEWKRWLHFFGQLNSKNYLTGKLPSISFVFHSFCFPVNLYIRIFKNFNISRYLLEGTIFSNPEYGGDGKDRASLCRGVPFFVLPVTIYRISRIMNVDIPNTGISFRFLCLPKFG